MSMFWSVTLNLLEGFGMTLTLFALTLLFAIPLGLIIAFGSMSKLGFRWYGKSRFDRRSNDEAKLYHICPIAWICRLMVWVIRGTPLMLQLIVIFYGPGLLGFDLLPRFTAVLIAFVINYACYFSEIFRGGIESIPKGQYEAGQVLGMTRTQTSRRWAMRSSRSSRIPPLHASSRFTRLSGTHRHTSSATVCSGRFSTPRYSILYSADFCRLYSVTSKRSSISSKHKEARYVHS